MGGSLKFPRRKKYVHQDNAKPKIKEEEISSDEHERRINLLKQMGVLK